MKKIILGRHYKWVGNKFCTIRFKARIRCGDAILGECLETGHLYRFTPDQQKSCEEIDK